MEWLKGLRPSEHGLVGGGGGSRYAALPFAGLVQDRPRPLWQRWRVTCAVTGPSTLGRPKMAKAHCKCLAFCPLHCRFDMRPLAAPGQMGHSSL
jgi:hypothetical protein